MRKRKEARKGARARFNQMMISLATLTHRFRYEGCYQTFSLGWRETQGEKGEVGREATRGQASTV